MTVHIYARVSRSNRANGVYGGLNSNVQIDECFMYCKNKGLDKDHKITVYDMEGSARNGDNIATLKNILDEMNKGDILVVHTIDRFCRSLLDGLKFLDELHKKGCKIVSVYENITYDPENIYDRFEFRSILNHAELESDRMSVRIKRSKSKSNNDEGKISSTKFVCLNDDNKVQRVLKKKNKHKKHKRRDNYFLRSAIKKYEK